MTEPNKRLSERAYYAIELANAETANLKHTTLDTVHILLGLMDEKDGIAGQVLQQAGFTRLKLREVLKNIHYMAVSASSETKGKLSANARQALQNAGREAIFRRHWQITTGHLLLGILKFRFSDANLRKALDLVNIPATAIATRTSDMINECDDPLDAPLSKVYSNDIDRDKPIESFTKWVSNFGSSPAPAELLPTPNAVAAGGATIRRRIVNLNHYLRDESDHEQLRIQRAIFQFCLREYDAVIAGLAPLLSSDLNHFGARFLRSCAYYHKNDYEKSLSDANIAIPLKPEHAVAWRYRAYSLIELGESERAVADLMHAMELKPDDLDIYCERAYAYLENEEFTLAFADADHSLQINPENFCALHYRGSARVGLGDYVGAQADFKAEAPLGLESSLPFSDMAGLQLKQGRYDSVIEFCDYALKKDANDWMAIYYRGCAFAAKGMREAAISDYQKALPEFLKSKSKRSVRQSAEMQGYLNKHGISFP